MYDCGSKACYHFDSISNSNQNFAKTIVNILSTIQGFPKSLKMHRMHSLQQINGWDCGIYTIAYCHGICQALHLYEDDYPFRIDDPTSFKMVKDVVTQQLVSEYREYIRSCIENTRNSTDL